MNTAAEPNTTPVQPPVTHGTATTLNAITDSLAAAADQLRGLTHTPDAADLPSKEYYRIIAGLGDIDLLLMDLGGLASLLACLHGDGGDIPSEAIGGLSRLASVTHKAMVAAHSNAHDCARAMEAARAAAVAGRAVV